MNFQDFHFRQDYLTNKENLTYHNINGEDCEIEVQKYLPISDKIDLIATALQKAEQNGIYNELLLDMYFNLNIIYLYTNINFSPEDRADEFKLYDILETEHIFDDVIAVIEQDYKVLNSMLLAMKEAHLNYKNTAAAVIRSIITDLPASAAAAKEILDTFDQSKFQEVVDFATAANGGRNINNQTVPVNPAALQSQVKKPIPQRKVVNIEKPSKKD